MLVKKGQSIKMRYLHNKNSIHISKAYTCYNVKEAEKRLHEIDNTRVYEHLPSAIKVLTFVVLSV